VYLIGADVYNTFFDEDINIYSFSNKNVNYKKSYTSCYVSKATLIGSYSSTKNGQFYLLNV